MFIFKIVMIGLKKSCFVRTKGERLHHQQLFLKAFSETYTEDS